MAIDGHITSNGDDHNYNRAWNLAALRGEIGNDAAYATIRAARALADDGTLDQESLEALLTGDIKNGHDERRFETLEQTWLIPGLEEDAATVAALEQLVADRDDDYLPSWAHLIIDGKTWLTNGPDTAQPLWGTNDTVLAALNQPTTIAGPQGSGKSVFGQRLALGWIGAINHILGHPVHHGERNVLYLASDRPDQARLSMRRMVTNDQLDTLEARLRVWKGPPPEDVAKQPLMLLEMAEVADADLIVIDSAKDIAIKLSADEVGAAYNSALQHCVAADIQIVALHHPRKLSGETRDNPVRVLDDLYGAYWVTAGNGSVVYLQPGDFDTYTLTQLKSPIGNKAEIPYEHVTATGDVRPPTIPDLITILDQAGYDGITAIHIARILYKVDQPNESQSKKIRRTLSDLETDAVVESFGATRSKKWRLIESIRTSDGMSKSNLDNPSLIRTQLQVSDSDTSYSDKPPPVLRQGVVQMGNETPDLLGPLDTENLF